MMYAKRAASEKAGIFVESLSEVKMAFPDSIPYEKRRSPCGQRRMRTSSFPI